MGALGRARHTEAVRCAAPARLQDSFYRNLTPEELRDVKGEGGRWGTQQLQSCQWRRERASEPNPCRPCCSLQL